MNRYSPNSDPSGLGMSGMSRRESGGSAKFCSRVLRSSWLPPGSLLASLLGLSSSRPHLDSLRPPLSSSLNLEPLLSLLSSLSPHWPPDLLSRSLRSLLSSKPLSFSSRSIGAAPVSGGGPSSPAPAGLEVAGGMMGAARTPTPASLTGGGWLESKPGKPGGGPATSWAPPAGNPPGLMRRFGVGERRAAAAGPAREGQKAGRGPPAGAVSL